MMRYRTFMLALALVGTPSVALVENSRAADRDTSFDRIVAALQDPLAFFAERSPGGRGSDALLSTKQPHERVLSTVRDRTPPADISPAIDPSVFDVPPQDFSSNGFNPADAILPESQASNATPVAPSFLEPGTGGSGLGGAGPGGTGITPILTPPPTTTVAEPATWTMMIFGILATIAAARWRPRRQSEPAFVPKRRM